MKNRGIGGGVRHKLLSIGVTAGIIGALWGAPAAFAAPPQAVVKTASKSIAAAPAPTLGGTPKVGQVLSARAGTWAPSAVTLKYQWKRAGVNIAGATGTTYRAVAADAGKKVAVTVTGSKASYTTTSRTSTAVLVSATGPVSAIPADGTHLVGKTLAPGTYVTAGTAKGCFWKRLKANNHAFTSILGQGFGYGQRVVTVSAGDVALLTQNCGAWKPIAAAGLSKKSSIPGDGVYVVSAQINPGLYRASSAAKGCVWERIRNYGGATSGIIAHGFSKTTPPTVRINAGDAGFESAGCGSWSRVGN